MEPSNPPPVPSQVPSMPPEKKRKRTSSAAYMSSRAPNKGAPPQVGPSAAVQSPVVKATLIIDNGGHMLKYGWSTDSSPKLMPNITAKLLHQWTVLVGDEIDKVQPNQVETTTRSTERGIITNFANQIQVWKRVLDDMGIVVPTASEAANVFGWKVAASSKTSVAANVLPQSCAVLLLVPPHCPRTVLETCSSIWFQEFQFGRVGFATSPVMAANNNSKRTASCIVDMGWSATHIVPVYRQAPLCIRRMPLGGRHLIQLYKYHVSYRQWNLMDQEFLLEEIQHQVGFLSLDFEGDLLLARRVPLGRRPFDREFVLPDYSTTYKGFVRLPAALKQQQQQEAEAAAAAVQEQEDSAMKGGDEAENDKGKNNKKDEDDDGVDDEEESDETKRRRILRQRQEEERRRQELEAERQVLMVSVERFTIPEVLFRPTDAGLAASLCGLPQAIVASISSCPREYQAIMYQSIRIVGGLAQLTNLQARLQRELRSIAPCQYEVRVQVADSPMEQAWLGAKNLVEQKPYDEWSIRMDEWDSSQKGLKKVKAWHRLLAENGGAIV